jgi:hypothetical protein
MNQTARSCRTRRQGASITLGRPKVALILTDDKRLRLDSLVYRFLGAHYLVDIVATLPLFAASLALYRRWGRYLIDRPVRAAAQWGRLRRIADPGSAPWLIGDKATHQARIYLCVRPAARRDEASI